MFRLLSRLVAVVLLALAPVIGVGQVQAVTREEWPTYPSLYFSSTLCQFDGGSGSVFINCAPGGQIVSQINSSYQCNQINVTESGYEAGPISLTMVTNDGLNSQTISIDGNGTWYVQIPGPFPLNAVVLEFSMPDGAGFLLPNIYSSPCPVATSTPTSAPSNTPNPSFTATPTVNPSFTPTAIPTYTPLPNGHVTFTPTATVPPVATSTPGPSYRNCGDWTFPLLNCDFVGGVLPYPSPGTSATYWWSYITSNPYGMCYSQDSGGAEPPRFMANFLLTAGTTICKQTVVAHASGYLFVRYQASQVDGSYGGAINLYYGGADHLDAVDVGGCPYGGTVWCTLTWSGVVSGNSYDFGFSEYNPGGGDTTTNIDISNVWVQASSGTPTPQTPVPGTSTATPTSPPGSPSATPYVNPFWTATPGTTGTAIPTDTECPGGCAVAALTTVPGISTMVTVDTSPFSPLLHLSLSRSPCTPFGYVQIPYPVITGTPALGQPLSFGWTVPVTHTWDDTNIITNTAIQPCAMAKEVSPYVWDFTYWGSGVALAIVFTIWLIGWVGRLSGDHTING